MSYSSGWGLAGAWQARGYDLGTRGENGAHRNARGHTCGTGHPHLTERGVVSFQTDATLAPQSLSHESIAPHYKREIEN